MALTKATSGGDFFKPAEHLGSHVILFVPQEFEKDAPNGNYGTADAVYADIYVFDNEAALVSGSPSHTLTNAKVQKAGLVRPLKKALENDNEVVGKLGKAATTKGNDAFVLNTPDDATFDLVAKYLEQGKAADAAVLASAGTPPW